MILLDETDPLNTGVEIQVRLPGKRLKNIRENTLYSLNYNDHKNLIEQREESGKKYKQCHGRGAA